MEELLIRAKNYELFADIFSMPKAENSVLSEDNSVELLYHLLVELNLELKDSKLIDIPDKLNEDELLLEYTRLFLGPFKVLTPPYGSFYIEQQQQLNQESTVAVKKIYSKFNLDISDDFKDLPDHIVAELEFMQFILYNQIENEKDSEFDLDFVRSHEKHFFNTFFYPFATKLCNSIIETTNVVFYKSIAKIFIEFLKLENKRVISSNVVEIPIT